MKLMTVEITNVRSFRDRTTIELDDTLNLFIGPNGGGKSNLLDIVTVGLRAFLLKEYSVNRQQGQLPSLGTTNMEAGNLLKKFLGSTGESKVTLALRVEPEDISSLKAVVDSADRLKEAFQSYQTSVGPAFLDECVKTRPHEKLTPGEILSYEIKNNVFQSPAPGSASYAFYSYLQHYNLLWLLDSEKALGLHLAGLYCYLSPIRSTGGPLRVSLGADNNTSWSMRVPLSQATSRSGTSFAAPAVAFLAEKHLRMENAAEKAGYGAMWDADPDVQTLKRGLSNLNYDYTLKKTDVFRNEYQLDLTLNGVPFDLTIASSGEQEILNFVFALLARELKGGLLIIDEPELHLHPQWQRFLLRLLMDLQRTQHNQIVVATHSGTFISPESLPYVTRVYRESDAISRVARVEKRGLADARAVLHMVNAQNNEKMFFANVVVLVEGITDRLVFEALLRVYAEALNDQRVIEVIDVNGKSNFDPYRKLLEMLRVGVKQVADLDAIRELGPAEVKKLFVVDYGAIQEKVIKGKKSNDKTRLALGLEEAIQGGDMGTLKEIWNYIKGRHGQLEEGLSGDATATLRKAIDDLSEKGIFILRRGEMEAYLPTNCKSLDEVIKLTERDAFREWLRAEWDTGEMAELRTVARSVLSIDSKQETTVRDDLTPAPAANQAGRPEAR